MLSQSIQSEHEIIYISSDDEDGVGLKVSEEIREHSCGKRKREDGFGNNFSQGDSVEVEEDDDCLILDVVPEGVISGLDCADFGAEIVDEILIVGERGQFACRDYPHPRYLCAKFMFSTTPHKKHCDMCHCYVCDCPAPCIYWTEHCSATHEEQSWRVERQLCRKRRREHHNSHQHLDVKPAFVGLRQPASKSAQSLSSNEKAKSTWHDDSLYHFEVKPEPAAVAVPNSKRFKSSSSLLPKEPKSVNQIPRQLTRASRCHDSPRRSTEEVTSRPKNILYEIYKNCPLVISCRRRIPPPCVRPDELSDPDQDD